MEPTKRANAALILAVGASIALMLAACTGRGLSGESNGWSPSSGVALPSNSGSTINAGRTVDPLDNTFTVTNASAFTVGQVLQIDDERMQVTAIRDQDLIVERGIDNTAAQSHADQAIIYTIGSQFVVFITTKQGEIKALFDDGTGAPLFHSTFRPAGSQR